MKNLDNPVVKNDLQYICSNIKDELNKLSGKRLLITGGAGFLGYYLAQSVVYSNEHINKANPVHITIYDNFLRGLPDWLLLLKENKSVTLVKHDIIDTLPSDTGDFDYIIHAASIASPLYYRKYPIETMDANVIGLRHLLEYLKRQNEKGTPIQGFLFFSTSEIYGDPDPENIPTLETYRGNVSCTGPRACYDESKRYGETLCVNFAKQYDLPVKIARPFNNYGPGLHIKDRRVIPDFMNNILSGSDIEMFSDGSPSRTFCYIADAIVGYYKLLINGRAGEAYNIGTERPEISMRKLAELLVSIAKKEINYTGRVILAKSTDNEYLTDNPNRRCPDITKARTELGYNPSISLEDGLRRSLFWYKTHNVENMESS